MSATSTSSTSAHGGGTIRPIRRLLIANRGEIACRIARTAARLGISTVGVYSEPDRHALHVDAVDVAVALGGATPAESYLRGDAIIGAAQRTGSDAIHPGYGFLAENADFARAVEAAGLIWVGPTPEQIDLLGDKVAAKRAAVEAGVPTTPVIEASPGDVPTDVVLPAIVKAAAGGGGRGMRVVRSVDELAAAVAAGAREAEAAFGDGTVFIEPYIERGRHIEVQIIGDQYGNVVHLGERDCSIQRRNQKIVEESPAAGLSDDVRTRLHAGALALARHVGYVNAGTVEFMVGAAAGAAPADADEGAAGAPTITFLEVNTRLQVEHPVTEAVTGVDLVELQLRVAMGEPLALDQSWVAPRGHAIEVRVVAEDPSVGWLPSTGTVTAFDLSAASDELVRVDTGFRAGSVVSSDYDSLLAKVIAHGATRREAAARLERALRSAQVGGVRTNLDCLIAVLGEPDFLAADTTTAYLDQHPEVRTADAVTGDDELAHLLALVFAEEQANREANGAAPVRFALPGWRNVRTQGQRRTWRRGPDAHQVEYVVCDDTARALVGPWPEPDESGALGDDTRRVVNVRLLDRSSPAGDDAAERATVYRQTIEVDGLRQRVEVVFDALDGSVGAGRARTSSPAGSVEWERDPRFVDHEADAGGGGPICPLPGTVLAVNVAAGQQVADGDVLMVIEAMKMEHKITASSAAVVSEVHFATGDRVDQGDLLVSLEAAE